MHAKQLKQGNVMVNGVNSNSGKYIVGNYFLALQHVLSMIVLADQSMNLEETGNVKHAFHI